MVKRNNLIGFAGRARSGKTTLSKYLQQEKGAKIVTIASYLKKLCCEILSLDLNTLLEYKDNNTELDYAFDNNAFEVLSNSTGISRDTLHQELDNVIIHTVREMLQVVGTNVIRKYNPDWHVNQMREEILSFDEDTMVVIDDVRFPNERRAIEMLGGIVLFIVRPSFDYISNHESETSLRWYNFSNTHIILNYTGIHGLFADFDIMLKSNFNIIPPIKKDYDKYVDNNNHMFGIQYNDINSMEIMFSKHFKDVVSIDNKDIYPAIAIDTYRYYILKNNILTLRQMAEGGHQDYLRWYNNYRDVLNREISLTANDKKGLIYISNPYVIENMKLYL